jgi:hypothetical protein
MARRCWMSTVHFSWPNGRVCIAGESRRLYGNLIHDAVSKKQAGEDHSIHPVLKGVSAYAARRVTKRILAHRNVMIFSIWEKNMGEKLQQGDRFPSLTLKLAQGGTIRLPDEMPTRYAAVLFYRGHW